MNRPKQLVWHTGFELCSRRTPAVTWKLREIFHWSCAYTPRLYCAMGADRRWGKACCALSRLPPPKESPGSRGRVVGSGLAELSGPNSLARGNWELIPGSRSVLSSLLNVAPNLKVWFPLVQLTSSLNWYWVTFLPWGKAASSPPRVVKEPSRNISM